MRSSRVALMLTICLSLLGGACGGASDPEVSGGTSPSSSSSERSENSGTAVTIEDFAFAPKTLSVDVGSTVLWTNADDILHTVTSGRGQKQGVPGVTEDKDARPDGTFDRELELDDTFEFTFDEAGTYRYFCAIHPGMTGVVVAK